MTTPSEMQSKVDKTVTNMDRLDDFVNGGPTTDVTLDGAVVVPSVQKMVAESGLAAGSASAAAASASAAAGSASAAAASASAAATTLTNVNAAGAAQVTAVNDAGAIQTANAAAQVVLANTAANSVTAQAVNIGPTKAVTTIVAGSTTPDTSNANMSSMWTTGITLAEPSLTTAVEVRFGTSTAIITLFLVDPVTRKVLAKSADLSAINGVTNFASPFGAFVAPKGTLLWFRRKSGTGVLRYGVGTTGTLLATSVDHAVGDTLGAFTASSAAELAIKWTTQAVSGNLENRLALQEATSANGAADNGDSETKTLGPAVFTVTGTSLLNFDPCVPVHADCEILGLKVNFSGYSTGILEFYRPVDGALTLIDRSAVTITASGDQTLTTPLWRASAGSFIRYHRLTGANPTYSSGYGYYHMAPATNPDIGGTAAVLSSPNASINMALIVRVPKRRSTRNGFRADKGPWDIEYQQFAGTTTPIGWSVASPFSVNDGLLASGAGGWDKVAQWRDLNGVLRGGWSGAHKRRLTAMGQINDGTSVGGISTAVQLTSTGGGTVAMIDGTAGKLRLYYWTGGATAGTLIAETALTAALVAGRQYLLSLVKDGWTVTATLTDVLAGTVTTVTGTFSTITSSRVHGRPGITHISGDFNWQWVRFANDAPRNLRAVLIGDSNSEGTLLLGATPWFTDLAATYGNMLNCSAGGEHTGHMLARITDIINSRPAMVIFAGGTNDVTQPIAFTRANIRAIADACDQVGAELVLVTPPPWPANAAAITAIANDMTSGYYGRRRVIDLLGLLSNANDRLTWNAAYNSGDNIHYNSAANTAIKAYVPRVIPELAL